MKIFFGKKNQPLINCKLLTQVHSNHVIVIDNQYQDISNIEADALVTTIANVKLAVKTADCTPILLYSQDVIAAVHAGWRGAHSGIIQNTIMVMKQLGASRISAYIGPCIRQNSYKIDKIFYKKFIDQDSENKRFFKDLYFDLPGYCKFILNSKGIDRVIDDGIDTYTRPDIFYSYRYYCDNGLDLDKNNRQFSSIVLD